MDNPEVHFKRAWAKILAKNHPPHYLRNIIRINADYFINLVLNADEKTANELAESINSGDAYILKGAHTKEEINDLKKRIIEWRKNVPQVKEEKMIEGCDDYHKINNVEMEGKQYYKTFDHPHIFFRWNGDKLKIFKMIDPYWEAVKILSGLSSDSFKNSTPKDGVIDKLSIFQYPMNFGRISKHWDPPQNQKVLLNLPLSEIGVDYAYGKNGFYVVEKESGGEVFLENIIEIGDYVCVSPTLHHGVPHPEYIDGHKDESPIWDTDKGRWLLAAISVPSHHIMVRKSTKAVND